MRGRRRGRAELIRFALFSLTFGPIMPSTNLVLYKACAANQRVAGPEQDRLAHAAMYRSVAAKGGRE